ncbi:hypothetical protein [Euzebya pacifica]|uniref:hypothetical protein n=1 Tax=Euzebya pacifica TaxID=1608957 RepID=UPI0030F4BF35
MLELQEICTAVVRTSELISLAQLATWADGKTEWFYPVDAVITDDDRRVITRLKLTASRIEDEAIREAVAQLDTARTSVLAAKTSEQSIRAVLDVQHAGGQIIDALGTRLRS